MATPPGTQLDYYAAFLLRRLAEVCADLNRELELHFGETETTVESRGFADERISRCPYEELPHRAAAMASHLADLDVEVPERPSEAAVRKAIADLQDEAENFSPPADLLARLAALQSRDPLLAAAVLEAS